MLKVRRLKKYFPVRKGWLRRIKGYVHAVDGVSFDVLEGETLGLVGESGCGKSTTGRTILRLIEPTSGIVEFKGRNIFSLTPQELRALRKEMQIIFQDPFGSLNPRLTVEKIIEEPLLTHGIGTRRERRKKVEEILERVGLLPEHIRRFPHEFSGGQRQRIMIARALIMNPSLIIGDEPVSALDVSVQAQILNLLARLQREFSFSLIIISHDLSVVRYICDKVAVMYLGKIVEAAPSEVIYEAPKHPYTKALISAVPIADPRLKRKRIILEGDVPSPVNPPSGCRFHPRCPERMDICSNKEPQPRVVADGHIVSCHHYGEGLHSEGLLQSA